MGKSHWLLYLFIICSISAAIFIDKYYNSKRVQPNNEYEELIETIDSLSSHIESLNKEKDSLRMIIDTTQLKIDTINFWYEKKLIDIVNQPIRDDVRFFSDYLSKTYSRFSNSNNPDSIKTD